MFQIPYSPLSEDEQSAVEAFKKSAGQWFDVRQAAEILGVTPRTIQSYIKAGRLNGIKRAGRWRFSASELQRVMTGGTTTPPPPAPDED